MLDNPEAADVEVTDVVAGADRVDEVDEADEAAAAVASVQLGLYISAMRCVITYVLAPALGVLGVVLGPIGILLQLLGTVMSVSGARRLWKVGHRARVPYAVLAGVLVVLTVVAILQFLAG